MAQIPLTLSPKGGEGTSCSLSLWERVGVSFHQPMRNTVVGWAVPAVSPAKAGSQLSYWIPAFAGKTDERPRRSRPRECWKFESIFVKQYAEQVFFSALLASGTSRAYYRVEQRLL